MIKINYFDERELLVRREIETKAHKDTETKGTQVLPAFLRALFNDVLFFDILKTKEILPPVSNIRKYSFFKFIK